MNRGCKPKQRPGVSWEKRQAIQVVALLPEDRDSALRVLEHARELVEGWWTPD